MHAIDRSNRGDPRIISDCRERGRLKKVEGKILYEDLGIEKCFNFKKTIFQNSLKRVGENEREILESCYFLFSLNISGFCWKE